MFEHLKDVVGLEGYNGVIADTYKESDFEYLGAELNVPKAKQTYWDNQIAYQQTEVNNYSCTVTGALGVLSDYFGYNSPLSERKDLWKEAVKKGADPERGWFTTSAVDLVRNYWNAKNPDKEVMSFRVSTASPDFYDVLEKGYSLCLGFNGNAAYTADKNKDGILNSMPIGRYTYGHVVRMVKNKDDNNYTMIVDNYPKTAKHNTYIITKELFEQMAEAKIFHIYGYFYVDKKEYDNLNNPPVIPLWAIGTVERFKESGIITNWSTPYDVIGNERLEWIYEKCGALDPTKHEGYVTLLRGAVALERIAKLGLSIFES